VQRKGLAVKFHELSTWTRHFAWLPINTVDRGMVWLRPYWTRHLRSGARYVGAIHVVTREWMF
jgi:hypothetical protein